MSRVFGASAEPASRDARLSVAHWGLIALCSAAYLVDGLTQSILGPLAPAISANLHISRAELGPVFSASFAGQSVGLILISLLPGRFGYRRVLVAAIASFGVLEIATAFAQSREQLIALRFLTGVGLGGTLPLCLALVSEIVPSARRGVSVMALSFAFGMGGFLAGIVASLFLAEHHWRYGLILVGAISLLSGLCSWRWLPESPNFLLRRAGGAAAAAPGRASDSPWRLFGPGMLLGFLMLCLAFIGSLFVNASVSSWMPTFLVGLGRTPHTGALSVSAFSSGALFAPLLVGLLIDRLGASRTLISFYALSAPFFLLVGFLLTRHEDTALMAVLAMAGFLFGGAYSGLNVVMAHYFPVELRSVGAGWTKSVSRVGTIIAPILIGMALGAGVTEQSIVSLFALSVMLVAAALVVVGSIIARRERGAAPPRQAPSPVSRPERAPGVS